MQFIEKSDLGVRSAVYCLRRDDSGLEFILFPMIHVGSREFYAEVRRRLLACDLILAEGVDTSKANLLTLSYRIVKRIKRMDLVTQREGLKLADLKSRILSSDMAGRAFNEHWSALPLKLKAQLCLFVPVYVVYLFFFGTRETIAEHIALEDLPAREELLWQDESLNKLDDLLIDIRDRALIQHIETLHRDQPQDKQTVAILYGAAHMRNVVGFLRHKLNYRITNAEWITVFNFETRQLA